MKEDQLWVAYLSILGTLESFGRDFTVNLVNNRTNELDSLFESLVHYERQLRAAMKLIHDRSFHMQIDY